MTAIELKKALESAKHIHFIGIGGSGMFPLAQILHARGCYMTGSDNNETETLELVRKMGITVFMGQRAENIEGADFICYTAAIMADNPELIAAKASGAVCVERSELLGVLTMDTDNAICISGTHGKTTTSGMTTQMLLASGFDTGAVLGGKLKAIGGSGRSGSDDMMVVESCEFVDTFLKLYPDIAVILNIDEDHLDYFKTLENLKKSFTRFASNAAKCLIYNGDDENTLDALKTVDKEKITFGRSRGNDYSYEILSTSGLDTRFQVYYRGEAVTEAVIHVPGEHNILNALAAMAAARYMGAEWSGIVKGLDEFHGTVRRFEKIAQVKGVTIVDDYAHHPAEIRATLLAAKTLDFKRIVAVHQPFTYSRTSMLLDDFAEALSIADKTVLTKIMGSREKNTYGIDSSRLQAKIEGCELTPEFDECVEYLVNNVREGDLVITMGCGDVYKVAKALAKRLEMSK